MNSAERKGRAVKKKRQEKEMVLRWLPAPEEGVLRDF